MQTTDGGIIGDQLLTNNPIEFKYNFKLLQWFQLGVDAFQGLFNSLKSNMAFMWRFTYQSWEPLYVICDNRVFELISEFYVEMFILSLQPSTFRNDY